MLKYFVIAKFLKGNKKSLIYEYIGRNQKMYNHSIFQVTGYESATDKKKRLKKN